MQALLKTSVQIIGAILRTQEITAGAASQQMLKRRSFGKTFVMWLFLGIFGGHYFYLYQIESGLIYLFTLGGFGIAWLSDIFVLSQLVFQTNQLVDHVNRRLLEQERRFGNKTIIDGEFIGHLMMGNQKLKQTYETLQKLTSSTRPVEQPKNRQEAEELCFNDENIVMQDFQGNYIEYQFEELRLKDYRAKQYDKQLVNLEMGAFKQQNPLSRVNLDTSVVNSPTINTKMALDELKPFLQNTPLLKQNLVVSRFVKSQRPDETNETTVNFEALQMSLVDVQRRNEERGL